MTISAKSRDKLMALRAGASSRVGGLGLRETKALSSAVPKSGEKVLLCMLICLNNLIRCRDTRQAKLLLHSLREFQDLRVNQGLAGLSKA